MKKNIKHHIAFIIVFIIIFLPDTLFAENITMTAVGEYVMGDSWDIYSASSLYTYALNSDYTIDLNAGILYRDCGWPIGTAAIKVTYTAGYAVADMPEDVKDACKLFCKIAYNKRNKEGVASENAGGISSNFDMGEMPLEVKNILVKYKRILL